MFGYRRTPGSLLDEDDAYEELGTASENSTAE